MILVVIRDKPLHLLRAHASIRLRHVNNWQIEVREDINSRPHNRQNGRQRECHHKDNDGYGPSQCQANEPHGWLTCPHHCWLLSVCRNGCRSPRAAAAPSSARHTLSVAIASSLSA